MGNARIVTQASGQVKPRGRFNVYNTLRARLRESAPGAGHVLTVVAAIIEHQGKILVCQRARGGRFELMWEFPGGKIEPGESPAQALARELREELGVTAKIGREVFRAKYSYAEMREPIELIFFAAGAAPEEIQNKEFEQVAWRTPESLPELNFLAADRELISKLASGAIRVDRHQT
jgi:8-oxo-dGTP diphosphatase